MKYIFKSRGLGKTSDIVRLCYENNGIILVADENHKRYIYECVCPRMGIAPGELRIITWNNKPREIIPEDTPIYIDEFDGLLEKIVGHRIEAISGSLE